MERGVLTRWAVPSVGDAIFLCVFLRVLSLGGQLLNDGDTGWHIAVGRDILENHAVPRADAYSYTASGAQWTAHGWLSDVVFALVHGLTGLNGVVLLSAAVIALTFRVFYGHMRGRGVDALTAALMTLAAAAVSADSFLARPHIFSALLTLVFFAVLEDYQRQGRDRLMALPPLMLVWVNLHGGFALGIALVLIYACGNAVLSLMSPEGGGEAAARTRRLGLTAVLTLAASLINPRGPEALYLPFRVRGSEDLLANLFEWTSPNFHTAKTFEFVLLFFIIVFVLSRKAPDIFEGAAALFMTHLVLHAVRFMPLFALTVAPLAAMRVPDALGRLAGAAPRFGLLARLSERIGGAAANISEAERGFDKKFWVYAPLAVCVAVAVNGGAVAGHTLMDYRFDRERFPVDAYEFAVQNGIKGNMLNAYGWGGYIIYRGGPRFKVFVDGRLEPYSGSVMEDYLLVERAKLEAGSVLDRYKVDWLMLPAGQPVSMILEAGGCWRRVYCDGTAEIIVRDGPVNRALIERYAGKARGRNGRDDVNGG